MQVKNRRLRNIVEGQDAVLERRFMTCEVRRSDMSRESSELGST